MPCPLIVPSAFAPLHASTQILALARSLTDQLDEPTVVIVALSAKRTGGPVLIVHALGEPDAVVRIGQFMSLLMGGGQWKAIAAVSTLAAGPPSPDDIDRWYELAAACDVARVELLDWIVDADVPYSVPELIGHPPARRWRRDVVDWLEGG